MNVSQNQAYSYTSEQAITRVGAGVGTGVGAGVGFWKAAGAHLARKHTQLYINIQSECAICMLYA
jgi:hypothetical protein